MVLVCFENKSHRTPTIRKRTHPAINLRSALGYVLSFDGKIVDNSAKQVVKQGTEGAEKGEEYAKQVVRTYPQDVALVVVANVEYAPYVAARGRDVLDSAKLTAEQLIKELS